MWIRPAIERIINIPVDALNWKDNYSVIKPATGSDSASGKSWGTLFGSAGIETKKRIKNK
jgi:hypothetical protein